MVIIVHAPLLLPIYIRLLTTTECFHDSRPDRRYDCGEASRDTDCADAGLLDVASLSAIIGRIVSGIIALIDRHVRLVATRVDELAVALVAAVID